LIAGGGISMNRKEMEKALKQKIVPLIREMHFKGTFPKFTLQLDGYQVNIQFQFYSSGGAFCVNIWTNKNPVNPFHIRIGDGRWFVYDSDHYYFSHLRNNTIIIKSYDIPSNNEHDYTGKYIEENKFKVFDFVIYENSNDSVISEMIIDDVIHFLKNEAEPLWKNQ
jgi:hypothetical protein